MTFKEFEETSLAWLKMLVAEGMASIPTAALLTDKGTLILAMPNTTDSQQRHLIRQMSEKQGGTAVAVLNEVWTANAHPDDKEGVDTVMKAKADGTIHLLPPEYRGEAYIIYLESLEDPVRMWKRELKTEDWEELRALLPRPGWKRFLYTKEG